MPLLLLVSTDLYILLGILCFGAAGLRLYWTAPASKMSPIPKRDEKDAPKFEKTVVNSGPSYTGGFPAVSNGPVTTPFPEEVYASGVRTVPLAEAMSFETAAASQVSAVSSPPTSDQAVTDSFAPGFFTVEMENGAPLPADSGQPANTTPVVPTNLPAPAQNTDAKPELVSSLPPMNAGGFDDLIQQSRASAFSKPGFGQTASNGESSAHQGSRIRVARRSGQKQKVAQ